MSEANQAVFLSYASQDKEAAKRICDALRAAGLEVWFDVSELRGGDAWDAKIRKQIKECALFVPIISATTNSRPEGYFRLEWKLAVDRSHLLADDHPFLFPIAIGDITDATARVPDKFREVQWTRLRLDETPAELAQRISRLLAGNGGTGSRESGRTASQELSPPGKKKKQDDRPAWLKHAWSLVGLAFAVYYLLFNPIMKRINPRPEKPQKPLIEIKAGKDDKDDDEDLENTRKALASVGQLVELAKSDQAAAPASSPASGLLSPSTRPEVASKSVAVLAFANLSDDKNNEYFSDGISEELLNVLAKIPELKVAARTSAFYFKGKEVPVPEIAKQLGVAYVVEGSVRKSGDKVRITAQLIKAADGFHVWSDTFTRDVKDIFGVQDEIAGLIAKNLELKMGFVQASANEAINSDAYQEYLLGRASMAKSSMADLREAVVHFSRATVLEPKYVPAWVQLASVHTRLGRWGGAPTLQSWAAARAAIDQALALEPDSPEVLVALGWIQRTGEWDWKGAEKSFRRALALRPDQPEVMAGAAVVFFNIGKEEEAYRLAQKAVQLDPLNPSTHIDLSIMFYLNQKWVESEQAARRALQLAPGGTSYRSLLGWSLTAQQRFSEAEAEINRDRPGVDQINALGNLAIARDQGAAARALMGQLETIALSEPDSADLQHSIAWIAVGLGEKDRAFAALEKARISRDPSMAWLRNSWYLEPLFSDPRWDVLLHKVGLADDQLK